MTTPSSKPDQTVRRLPLLIFIAVVIIGFIATIIWHHTRPVPEQVPKRDLADIRTSGKLRVLMNYDPINYFIYRGAVMGYSYELAKRFARHLEIPLEVVVVKDMNLQCSMLRDTKGDLIAHFITITPERKKLVDFSIPLDTATQVLIQRKPNQADSTNYISSPKQLAGKTVCVRKKSAYYTTLKDIMKEHNITFKIATVEGQMSTSELISKISDGTYDYTVADDNIAATHKALFPNIDDKTRLSPPMRLAWAVRKNSPELLTELNDWLEQQKRSGMLAIIHNKYYNQHHQFKKRALQAFYSDRAGTISRYDDLVKKYAKTIGWDWRLLSALIYEESRFDPNAISWAGAKGLMQLMPATEAQYGSSNLFNPSSNLRAGTKVIRSLQRMWQNIEDADTRCKFILASYNVGPGHVLDAQRLAKKYGADPKAWEENVEKYLKLKSEPKYYNDPVARHGYCNGDMAAHYARHVIRRYNLYKEVIP